jgi:hypothetical protein
MPIPVIWEYPLNPCLSRSQIRISKLKGPVCDFFEWGIFGGGLPPLFHFFLGEFFQWQGVLVLYADEEP